MKKEIISFITAILMLSCGNQLDIYPHSAVAPESITEKDLPALENGMYYCVQNYPPTQAWILDDIIGGTLATSTGNPLDLINLTLSPLNSVVANSWSGYYRALYQINNVLKITENLESSDIRNRVKGEAHYFRAFIYYCLVTRWGDVPLLKENTLELVSRDPKSLVWAFIEEELETAISLLGGSSGYYYVSKDAAIALKARVMLSQNKMDEAKNAAETIINGSYKLDSFEKIFRKQQNTEVIFAFENLSEESNNNISSCFYTYAHPNKGSYLYRPTKAVMDMYETGDKRKDISIAIISGSDCVNKYPSGQTGTDPVVISRLSEMYLISAEAQGRVNGVDRLNELRNFRGLSDIYPATDDDFITAILQERKKELLGEGFMYFDLVRTGRAQSELGLLDHQLVLPIPGKELLLNPNLTPNKGY